MFTWTRLEDSEMSSWSSPPNCLLSYSKEFDAGAVAPGHDAKAKDHQNGDEVHAAPLSSC